MFSNLKTLLLREWCVVPDFSGLLYFLQYSPILEKLTLQLYSNMVWIPTYDGSCLAGVTMSFCKIFCLLQVEDVEIDESYSPAKQFMASKHLKVVEIKCLKEYKIIHHILKILCTHGVPREKIYIQANRSFACK
jgi:hypothetical protein